MHEGKVAARAIAPPAARKAVGRMLRPPHEGPHRAGALMIDPDQRAQTRGLAELAQRLTASGDYKVLRRLVPRPLSPPSRSPDASERIGIVIDVETTGLNHMKDEVIELAMVKFRYRTSGEIIGVTDVFRSFNQPSIPIPPEIIRLTGITDAMVAGRTIDPSAVEAFVADDDIVIAHNAAFDRKFAECAWPIFEHKPWACSMSEVDWKSYGFGGVKLSYLVMEAGFFYGAHRAIDDCHALLEILARPLPASPKTALAVLLERARRPTFRIWAENSPFDLKDILKARGYRWNDGADGSLRSWYVDVDEDLRAAELEFLRKEIYRRDVDLRCVEYSALERFSLNYHCRRSASSTRPTRPMAET
jgi:DNA polymerase-3 subunit epsilon